MATVLFFHAHPDDEVLFTGGTMARAAAAGHRVVLVTATRGERGQDRAGTVGPGETMAERRELELRRSVSHLGVARCEILGFADSGIDGDAGDGFTQFPVETAASQLAQVLAEEAPGVFVTYDERGVYGHPDHIHVHLVGTRAAELAGVPSVLLVTFDGDRLQSMLELAAAAGLAIDEPALEWTVNAGMPGERITTEVDVGDYAEIKRVAMAEHATQFAGSQILTLAPPLFRAVFGTEWFIEVGATVGERRQSWLWRDDDDVGGQAGR